MAISGDLKDIHSKWGASLRLAGLLAWGLLLMPLLILATLSRNQNFVIFAGKCVYRGLMRVCGFRLQMVGRPDERHPVLYASNHCSYFDIVVLGSILDAHFVAKKEVGDWPVIGPMARHLAGTIFVERLPRHSKSQANEMSERLSAKRESLILFPEGTSGDGRTVLPFKSALFAVAELAAGAGHDLHVQPISIAYTRLDGLPLGRNWRPHYAWYGDMDLASHIWVALGLGHATVQVVFHESVNLKQFGSRKALADYCRGEIGKGLIAANRGRAGELVAKPEAA